MDHVFSKHPMNFQGGESFPNSPVEALIRVSLASTYSQIPLRSLSMKISVWIPLLGTAHLSVTGPSVVRIEVKAQGGVRRGASTLLTLLDDYSAKLSTDFGTSICYGYP